MSHHLGGIVLVVLASVGMVSLAHAERFCEWRTKRRARVDAVNAVLAAPAARTRPRQLDRDARLAHLDAIWQHTNQGFINQHIGMWELDVADLQPLADGLLDEEASR